MSEVPLEEYIMGSNNQIVKRRVDQVSCITNKNRKTLEKFFTDVLGGEFIRNRRQVNAH
jgi:hypothetical protein